MFQRNGKFVLALSLLLMLSQWLSLAHATEHMVDNGDAYCHVCTLQHQYQGTTIGALPFATIDSQKSYVHTYVIHRFTKTPDSTRTIRAPPL